MQQHDFGKLAKLVQLTAERTQKQDQAIASILKLLDETSSVTLALCEAHPELQSRAEKLRLLRQNFA